MGTSVAAPRRRLIAAGVIRRQDGRTFTVRVTQAGVTGVITKQVTR
ncbi:hypothetical protein ABZV34_16560 [Streptomyces sp. NPDC005195]